MSDTTSLTTNLRRLIDEMRATGFSELDLQAPRLKVRMILGPAVQPAVFATAPVLDTEAEEPPTMPVSRQIRAERVGVFSFGRQRVETGATVIKGQTLGLIKGISIQDQVIAPVAGRLTAVLVEEGQIIDFGRPLFELLPEA
ncbi:MAG TPA: biotin/lipoyl-containing protein [Candidatus Ozemobacteraceae bacterium]